MAREFVNPALSRAALGRCLRRHGVSSLLELAAREGDKPVTKKSFKDYEPGFLQMPQPIIAPEPLANAS